MVLLIPGRYQLILLVVLVHLLLHHIVLVLTLSVTNHIVFLSEFVAVGGQVVKFFLGIGLDVGDILAHNVLLHVLVSIHFLLFHHHALVKIVFVRIAFHLVELFFKVK